MGSSDVIANLGAGTGYRVDMHAWSADPPLFGGPG